MRTCPQCQSQYSGNERLCPKDGAILNEAPTAVTPKEEDSHIGQTLAGKYRIDGFVSRGGMGAVYKATHVMLGKPIAIKLIHPSLISSPETIKRFQREARAASHLTHPHIVTVHDLGQAEDGTLYIAMELVAGVSLKRLIQKEGALSPERCARFGRHIASALTLAHKNNIVHRDLKPQNVMVCKDSEGQEVAKLLDFGIAKTFEAEDGTALTSTGMVLGTPQYMAPEQAAGKPVDNRSDLYALGIILYEMMTGDVPFNDNSITTILYKHVWEAPKKPSERRPDIAISPELEAITLRCLAKEPEKRYQSADELLAELKAFSQGTAVAVPAPAAPADEPDVPRTVTLGKAGLAATAPATPTPLASPAAASQTTPVAPAAPAQRTQPTIAPAAAHQTLAAGVPPPVRRTNWAALVAILGVLALIGAAGGFIFLRAVGILGGKKADVAQASTSDVPTGNPAMALGSAPGNEPPPADPGTTTAGTTTAGTATDATTTGSASSADAGNGNVGSSPAGAGGPEGVQPVATRDAAAEGQAEAHHVQQPVDRYPGDGGQPPAGAGADRPVHPERLPAERLERRHAAREAAAGDGRGAVAPMPAAPPLPAVPPVFFRCDGNPPACMTIRPQVAQALERAGLPMTPNLRNAEVVVTVIVETSDEQVQHSFGTDFVVKTLAFEVGGEVPRFNELITMPAVESVSFDSRFGKERLVERARLIGDGVAEKVKAYWSKKTGR